MDEVESARTISNLDLHRGISLCDVLDAPYDFRHVVDDATVAVLK
jgi:hypothetical protein